MSLTPGRRLGDYEILAPLGAGGMGEVYLARDTKLGREVAIKVLSEALATDPERLARFRREAHLLASLNQPNIATLLGFEETDEQPFLVMELVEGETLAERLVDGPMLAEEALACFRQIAEGLEAAHERGIVHRDLKPSNIKITAGGTVKILDFGLAKAIEVEAAGRDLSKAPTLTREATETGILLGTAPYMSPEQARGKAVDKRTDLWAFGCCLYEALTGRPPFLGETVSDTLAAILDREPDWDALPASTPAPIRRLLRRCLEKNPKRRLRDAGDAMLEIDAGPAAPIEPVSIADTGSLRRRPAAALVLMTALLTGVAVWLIARRPTPEISRATTRFVLPDPPARTGRPRVALSPDGRRLAYVGEHSGTTALYLREMDEPEAAVIPDTTDAARPFFSPDGQWVGYYDVPQDRLAKIRLSGGVPVPIVGVSGLTGATWAPDGSIYYSRSSSSGIWRVDANGGTPERVTSPDVDRGEGSHRWPEVLPDANAVVFTIATSSVETFDEASIAVVSLETGEQQILIEGGSYAKYVPGHLLYVQTGSIFAVRFDPVRLEVEGRPVRVQETVVTGPFSGNADFDVSQTGTLSYIPGQPRIARRRLVWVDRQGNETPINVVPGPLSVARIAPDGSSLALTINAANSAIWIHDLERDTTSRLTHEWNNRNPLWTPDGTGIVFSSGRGRPVSLFWQPVDGSREAEPLTNAEFMHWGKSVSSDGGLVAFTEIHPENGGDLWLLPLDGDRAPIPFLQTPAYEGAPEFSPDGHWIAYASDETGRAEVYVRPYPGPGGQIQVSGDGGQSPLWAPDGDELFFRRGKAVFSVSVSTGPSFRAGTPQKLFEGPYTASVYLDVVHYDIAPDGRFLMIRDDPPPEPQPIHVVLNWIEEVKDAFP